MFKDEGKLELEHLDCIDQKVTHEDNIRLCGIPDKKEIMKAVFDLNLNSSPGPDGFGGSFCQKLSRFFTSSCLILLPKVENPSSFNDMRPISLRNYSNKIISKIMSSRLNSILPKIISDNQTGFLKGRSITENVLLAQKIIQGIGKKNFGGNTVIKLDMAKAYDRFRGFSMVQSGLQVTHLAYADDVIIFSSGGKRTLKLVMHQLQNYEKCSGQLINTGKSCFLVDPKASNIAIQRIKEVTGYRNSNFPITYLRCPLYVGRKRISHFSEIVSKLVKRTTGWQGKLLSVGGRATLIKHVLQSQPIYLLSALEPPKTVLKQLETYMARFFWGSDEVVKWHKPPEYWLKINTDRIKDAKGNSGIGGICRGHMGKLTMVFASSIVRTSSNMAEASAA
nr:uncharacterized protein LOC104117277 [Nicotiana tomentosiformis]